MTLSRMSDFAFSQKSHDTAVFRQTYIVRVTIYTWNTEKGLNLYVDIKKSRQLSAIFVKERFLSAQT